MNLYGVLERATYTVDRHSHQQRQKSTDRSFSNYLLDVAQSTGEAVKRGIDFVRRHPAQAFVSAVSLLPLSAARALPAADHPGPSSVLVDTCPEMDRAYQDPSTAQIAKAYDDCISLHGGHKYHFEYRRGFHFAQAEVRCLGESIRNLCGKRDPDSLFNGDYGNRGLNHQAVHTEGDPSGAKRDICTRLAGRAAGIEMDIEYAHRSVGRLLSDVLRIFQKSDDYAKHVKMSARHIIEKYDELASDTDDFIEESDVWAWAGSHADALMMDLDVLTQFKSPTDNRLISLLREMADELYKQTDMVRNSAVYQRLVDKINQDDTDRMIYSAFFDAVVEEITNELEVRNCCPEPVQDGWL